MKLITLTIFFISSIMYAQPKLEIVGGDTHDWGTVKVFESPLKTIITIKNTGNQPLRVFEVKPSCGCTTAPLDKDILNPGETAKIDIKLDLKGNVGAITKDVNIMT